ncbi:pentatricopeptide repeat-containing protein At1g62914, mitochondrial-like [Lotus japonicus]|uniref:pentatricopeptide repeat-containing protein At1g62914, mitochondrial-like n=1 Tax=Lotus japonicus TaxID=34305 RepID=UPI00258E7991|nr:pentatricopeptide repeat-containing protein At1g62914, mitochondrial-like [Lotus japonicus]
MLVLRSKVHQCLSRLYSSASSSLIMVDETPQVHANSEFNLSSVSPVPETNRELFHVVVRVIKSLNWKIAREKKFGSWVETHGFSHSVNYFRIIIHTFAMAGMHLEVFALLRDIVGYCKCDDSFEQFSTLLDLPHHSVLVFNVLIKVFASNSMLEHAHQVFVSAKNVGLELHIRSCNFLLKCLVEANRAVFVRFFFVELMETGPLPNIHTYTIMMSCGDIRLAAEILGKIYRSGGNPTVVTYGTYIRGLCECGYVDVAHKLVRKLHCKLHPLNSHCFNAVIHGFCQRGAVNEALEVLEEMKSSRTFPDVYSYNMLLNAFCKKGDVEKGLELMKEMELCQIKPSIVNYTSLILLCKNKLKGQQLYDKSLEVYNSMLQNAIRPNTIICNHILRVHCREGQFREALTLLEDFHEQGINLNQYSYNEIIHMICKESYPKMALELMPRMLKRNVLPGVVNYSTLISGFAKEQSNFEMVERLFTRLVKAGITFNTKTYTTLISIHGRTRKRHKAYCRFGEMIQSCLCPDEVSYTALIAVFCNIREMNVACALFQEMSRIGCLPNLYTYTCLIDGFCKIDYIDLATQLFDEMKRKGIFPDVVTYTVLIAWYHKHGRIGEKNKLFGEMKANCILLDDGIKKLQDPKLVQFMN